MLKVISTFPLGRRCKHLTALAGIPSVSNATKICCMGVRESEKSRGNPLRGYSVHVEMLSLKGRQVISTSTWQVPHLRGDCDELEQRRYSDPCERSPRRFPRHSETLLAHQSRERKARHQRASCHQTRNKNWSLNQLWFQWIGLHLRI